MTFQITVQEPSNTEGKGLGDDEQESHKGTELWDNF